MVSCDARRKLDRGEVIRSDGRIVMAMEPFTGWSFSQTKWSLATHGESRSWRSNMVGLSWRWNLLQMKYKKPYDLFHQVKYENRLCLMGVDTGECFTGLALAEDDLTRSRPFTVIKMCTCQGPGELADHLDNVIMKWKIGGLLVGYSAIMNNHVAEEDHKHRVFKWLDAAHESAYLAGFPFTFVDERYSSRRAVQYMGGRDPASSGYVRDLNKFAAFVFTQRWLDIINDGALYSVENNRGLQEHLESIGDEWNQHHGRN